MKWKGWIGLLVLLASSLACNFLFTGEKQADVDDLTTVVKGDRITLNGVHGGMLLTPDGVEILIPPAAFTDADLDLQVEIQVAVAADDQAILAEGFAQAGPIYDIRMDGGELHQPVMLSLPIPAGLAVDEIIGLTVYAVESERWVLVPAVVDEESGLVSTTVQGFSRWSIARISDISRHCSYYDMGARCWPQEKGAWLEITNSHILDTNINPALPDARYSGYAVNYGICILSAELDDPAASDNWQVRNNQCMTVSDYASRRTGRDAVGRWLLPAGRYELMEYAYVSERNPGNPLYIPVSGEYRRSIGRVEMRDGQTLRFSNNGNFSGWEGWGSSDNMDNQEESPLAESQDWPSDWVGEWKVTNTILEHTCRDCNDLEEDPQTRVSRMQQHYLTRIWTIPASLTELETIKQGYNQDRTIPRPSGKEVIIELNYPNYLMVFPYFEIPETEGSGTGRYMGGRWEGVYDQETDRLSGDFELWFEFNGEVYRGTWYAERVD